MWWVWSEKSPRSAEISETPDPLSMLCTVVALLLGSASAFMVPAPLTSRATSTAKVQVVAGLFDMFQESEESKKKKDELKDRQVCVLVVALLWLPCPNLMVALPGSPALNSCLVSKCIQMQEMKAMQEARRDPIASELASNRRRNVEMATQAANSGNLPSNWDSKVDPTSGQRYFFDVETKGKTITTWDPPIEEMVGLLEQQQREELEAAIKRINSE